MRYVAHGRLCTNRKVQIMKAAIYCRLSKEDEYKIGESESIQNQKSMLIQYAIEKGFDIYQIYSDEDYSGIDRNRPAFNSMIQAASEHKFDVVLPEQDDPIRQREQAKRDELKRLKNEVDRRRKAMQELYLDKVSGLIDTVQFAAMNEAFLQEVKQSETRIQTLESELKATKEDNDTVPAQMEKVRKLAQVPYLTRELVVLLIDRVVVEPKESLSGTQKVTIEWNF